MGERRLVRVPNEMGGMTPQECADAVATGVVTSWDEVPERRAGG